MAGGNALRFLTTFRTVLRLPRHLIRNAARLLEVRASGDIEILCVAGSTDDDSLPSFSQSSNGGESIELGPSIEDDVDNVQREAESETDAFGDRSGIECRLRRLEIGRRRAEQRRREKRVRSLKTAATEMRDMRKEDDDAKGILRAYLTCNPEALAAAAASFEGLVYHSQIQRTTPVLTMDRVCVVKNRICEEISKESSKGPRGSTRIAGADPLDQRTPHGRASLSLEEEKRVVPSTNASKERSGKRAGAQTQYSSPTCDLHQNAGDADQSPTLAHIPRPPTPGEAVVPPTLEEMLDALAGLVECVEGGPIGLPVYVRWWVGAVSEEQMALKSRFLTSTSKKGRWTK